MAPAPTYPEGDASTFELVVAGRALSETRADVAIMMVEAGGPRRRSSTSTGAPQVTEEVIAEGLEVAKTWIKRVDRPSA